jgi:hypothetical protein
MEKDAPKRDKTHDENLARLRQNPMLISVRKRTAFMQFSAQQDMRILRLLNKYDLCTDDYSAHTGGRKEVMPGTVETLRAGRGFRV